MKKAFINEYKTAYCPHCNRKKKPECTIVFIGDGVLDIKVFCKEHFKIAIKYMLYGLDNDGRLKKELAKRKNESA